MQAPWPLWHKTTITRALAAHEWHRRQMERSVLSWGSLTKIKAEDTHASFYQVVLPTCWHRIYSSEHPRGIQTFGHKAPPSSPSCGPTQENAAPRSLVQCSAPTAAYFNETLLFPLTHKPVHPPVLRQTRAVIITPEPRYNTHSTLHKSRRAAASNSVPTTHTSSQHLPLVSLFTC